MKITMPLSFSNMTARFKVKNKEKQQKQPEPDPPSVSVDTSTSSPTDDMSKERKESEEENENKVPTNPEKKKPEKKPTDRASSLESNSSGSSSGSVDSDHLKVKVRLKKPRPRFCLCIPSPLVLYLCCLFNLFYLPFVLYILVCNVDDKGSQSLLLTLSFAMAYAFSCVAFCLGMHFIRKRSYHAFIFFLFTHVVYILVDAMFHALTLEGTLGMNAQADLFGVEHGTSLKILVGVAGFGHVFLQCFMLYGNISFFIYMRRKRQYNLKVKLERSKKLKNKTKPKSGEEDSGSEV